jgi:hypothetical protein
MIPAEIKFDANATPPQWTDDGEQVIEKGTNIRIKIKGLRSEVDKMYAVGTMKEVRKMPVSSDDHWLSKGSRIILARCRHRLIYRGPLPIRANTKMGAGRQPTSNLIREVSSLQNRGHYPMEPCGNSFTSPHHRGNTERNNTFLAVSVSGGSRAITRLIQSLGIRADETLYGGEQRKAATPSRFGTVCSAILPILSNSSPVWA